MTETKKAPKKSFPIKKLSKDAKKKESTKKPSTRMGRLFRGPLFWIIAAIFAVSIFGQITSAVNKYTTVLTSQALDAISTSDVESAVVIDKSQKIRLVLKAGKTINGSSKVEASYVARQEPTIIDALTSNPPTKGWNVDVPTQSLLVSFLFSFAPILIIGLLFFFMMSQAQGGGNGVFQFGRSRAKLQSNDVPKTTFKDVAGAEEAARNVAMQAAAMNPIALNEAGVDAAIIENEIEIAKEQLRAEGKPEAMLDNISKGKIQRFYKDNTLVNQDYIKDSSMSVAAYIKSVDANLTVTGFKRVALG
jgi:hypothetical protein